MKVGSETIRTERDRLTAALRVRKVRNGCRLCLLLNWFTVECRGRIPASGGVTGTEEEIMKNFMACWKVAMSSSRRTVLAIRMSTGCSWLGIVSSGGLWY